MLKGGDFLRFWFPAILLIGLAVHSTQQLVRAHIDPKVAPPDYFMDIKLPALRGSIYSCYGRECHFARSVPFWEYRLDPLSLTNAVVRRRGQPQRPPAAIVRTISEALGLDYADVKRMVDSPPKHGWRSQFLALSSDPEAHRIIADSSLVAGVSITDCQVRQFPHGHHLSHVLGSVNADHLGSAGIEQQYNAQLTGTPGLIRGMRDARRRELYDKRRVSIEPVPGADVFLTIDHNIQYMVEDALRKGVAEYSAAAGWCIVMDSRTGAVLAMASLPDFDPVAYGHTSDDCKLNRACAFNYEPGSVMKVITAAAAIDSGFRSAHSVYRTHRNDPNYYKLPGDVGHVWEPTMTVADAIVHSSNIVIGKLGYDLGPYRLYDYMKKFGFGEKTGIGLPGEQYGILPNPRKRKWDKASWSRAAIGQFVAVTGIQLCSAYQAIANDGVRMRPYIVEKVVAADGKEIVHHEPTLVGRPISAKTAKTMREVMLGVASKAGTARRAAIPGYSVAGKTGTAQKAVPGGRGYLPGQFRGSFCGIVPASEPRLVILVTLDFDHKNYPYHQGGRSSGPIFKTIATQALQYLRIEPDRPNEIMEELKEND